MPPIPIAMNCSVGVNSKYGLGLIGIVPFLCLFAFASIFHGSARIHFFVDTSDYQTFVWALIGNMGQH